jgi:hypothetical protein
VNKEVADPKTDASSDKDELLKQLRQLELKLVERGVLKQVEDPTARGLSNMQTDELRKRYGELALELWELKVIGKALGDSELRGDALKAAALKKSFEKA